MPCLNQASNITLCETLRKIKEITGVTHFSSTSASTDGQLDRLADAAEHFYQRVDSELGRFFVHHVGHARARDH